MPQQPFILDLCNYFSLTCDTFSLLGQLTSIERKFVQSQQKNLANSIYKRFSDVNIFHFELVFCHLYSPSRYLQIESQQWRHQKNV